jgi:hypothetical protein
LSTAVVTNQISGLEGPSTSAAAGPSVYPGAHFSREEFVALLPDAVDDAPVAANRVRLAFEVPGATVSVGAAGGTADMALQ